MIRKILVSCFIAGTVTGALAGGMVNTDAPSDLPAVKVAANGIGGMAIHVDIEENIPPVPAHVLPRPRPADLGQPVASALAF